MTRPVETQECADIAATCLLQMGYHSYGNQSTGSFSNSNPPNFDHFMERSVHKNDQKQNVAISDSYNKNNFSGSYCEDRMSSGGPFINNGVNEFMGDSTSSYNYGFDGGSNQGSNFDGSGSTNHLYLRRCSISEEMIEMQTSSYFSGAAGGGDYVREERFCSDFSCCGMRLPDLHALLNHYEQVHVQVKECNCCPLGGNSHGAAFAGAPMPEKRLPTDSTAFAMFSNQNFSSKNSHQSGYPSRIPSGPNIIPLRALPPIVTPTDSPSPPNASDINRTENSLVKGTNQTDNFAPSKGTPFINKPTVYNSYQAPKKTVFHPHEHNPTHKTQGFCLETRQTENSSSAFDTTVVWSGNQNHFDHHSEDTIKNPIQFKDPNITMGRGEISSANVSSVLNSFASGVPKYPRYSQPSYQIYGGNMGFPYAGVTQQSKQPACIAADPTAMHNLRQMLPSLFSNPNSPPTLHLLQSALSSTLDGSTSLSYDEFGKQSSNLSPFSGEGNHKNGNYSDSRGDNARSPCSITFDKDPTRPFVCSIPGCRKTYKNANGLKYHVIHGHRKKISHHRATPGDDMTGITGSPGDACDGNDIDLREEEEEEAEDVRPYVCNLKGCGKTYKNANGLKYHLTHAHPDHDGSSLITAIPLTTIEAAVKREIANRNARRRV